MKENPYKPPLSSLSDEPSKQLDRLRFSDWLGAISFGLIVFITAATSVNVFLMLAAGLVFGLLGVHFEMETLIVFVFSLTLTMSMIAAIIATRWQNQKRLNFLQQSVESSENALPPTE